MVPPGDGERDIPCGYATTDAGGKDVREPPKLGTKGTAVGDMRPSTGMATSGRTKAAARGGAGNLGADGLRATEPFSVELLLRCRPRGIGECFGFQGGLSLRCRRALGDCSASRMSSGSTASCAANTAEAAAEMAAAAAALPDSGPRENATSLFRGLHASTGSVATAVGAGNTSYGQQGKDSMESAMTYGPGPSWQLLLLRSGEVGSGDVGL